MCENALLPEASTPRDFVEVSVA